MHLKKYPTCQRAVLGMAKNNIPYYRYYPCMDQKRYLRHKKTVDTVAIHSTIIAAFFYRSNYSISHVFGVYTRMSKCWVQNAEIVWKIALRQGWSHKDLIRFAPALFHGWTNAENHLSYRLFVFLLSLFKILQQQMVESFLLMYCSVRYGSLWVGKHCVRKRFPSIL